MNGLFGEAVRVSEQSLFGGRAVYTLSPALEVATSLVRTSAPGTGGALPLSSTEITADARYRWTPHVELIGQSSLVQFSAETDAIRRTGVDLSMVASTVLTNARGRAEATYLRLPASYMPLAYFSVGDRQGLYASGDQTFGAGVSVFGSVSRWRTGVGSLHSGSSIALAQATGGVRWRLSSTTSVGLGLGESHLKSDDEDLDSRRRNASLDVTRQFGEWRLLVRTMMAHTDSPRVFDQTGYQRADVEVRKDWEGGTSAWVTAGGLSEFNGDSEKRNSMRRAFATADPEPLATRRCHVGRGKRLSRIQHPEQLDGRQHELEPPIGRTSFVGWTAQPDHWHPQPHRLDCPG